MINIPVTFFKRYACFCRPFYTWAVFGFNGFGGSAVEFFDLGGFIQGKTLSCRGRMKPPLAFVA